MQKPCHINEPIDRKFPTWHFWMMNDHSRNNAIKNCIRDANVNGKIIFEIGTGAGLSAMLFVQHGAKKVITCEQNEQIYSIASELIYRNQLSNQIELFFGTSQNYLVNGNTNIDVDIIFTETLDCGVVGEGFYNIARDVQTLNTKNITIFPQSIFQFGYMVESEEIYSLNHVNDYDGFDLSAVNKFSTQNYFPVRANQFQTQSLSNIEKLKTYTYIDIPKAKETFSIVAYRSGICHGILSFFHAFYGSHIVSNDVRDNGHWHQAFHPFNQPINVEAGKQYNFFINQSGLVQMLS